MSETCLTCQPMPVCVENLDGYNLQGDVYSFVLNCPAGFYCGGLDSITGLACDGTELSAVFPQGASQELRDAILRSILNEIGRRISFCEDPPPPYVPPGDNPIIPTSPPVTSWMMYYNHPQTCEVLCPNGDKFTYTYPAGKVLSFSFAQANELARRRACSLARSNALCLSSIPEEWCEGEAISGNVRVSGPGSTTATTMFWAVTSGTLPPGLVLADGWQTGRSTTLTGTPTTAGSYTFEITVTKTDGISTKKSYTMCIVGITNASALPDGDENVAYTVTLTASACAKPPVSFQITAGALPAGLTLDEETGVISGTPTVSGDFAFTVTLQTEAT